MLIHSLESFGTVDGPGLRFVVFLQGCPLRCLYCHNPDTWDSRFQISDSRFQIPDFRFQIPDSSPRANCQLSTVNCQLSTVEDLLIEVLRYKNFIKRGGVTATGGEPLLQAKELREFFRLCQGEGIHTALDTSGFIYTPDALAVLDYTDLVLLDIKAIDPVMHKELTGVKQDNILRFLDYLEEKGIDTWVRHVIVPGYTDRDEDLRKLAEYLKPYRVVKKVELLPYHTMGKEKYTQLGLTYKLEGVEPLSGERLENARQIFQAALPGLSI
ncbi:radical SAM protein [Bacteroidales bacterium OttesenSCG-928-L03]|nr:radical SAM protein [Bacteroidales bacterium OttesenSCG-928-L03]